jgi:hypothetical protein
VTNDLQFIYSEENNGNLIKIYLVNQSNIDYKNLKVLAGSFQSVDDFVDMGNVLNDYGVFSAKSFKEIDTLDFSELDYSNWYQIDLIDSNDKRWQYSAQLPKGFFEYDKNKTYVSILNKEGAVIELTVRDGDSVEKNAEVVFNRINKTQKSVTKTIWNAIKGIFR